MQEWVDRLVDAGLDPRPLVVMMLERIEERAAERRRCQKPWERLCAAESGYQFETDGLQYEIRSAGTPDERAQALSRFIPRARRHVVALVRMIGRADLELREIRERRP